MPLQENDVNDDSKTASAHEDIMLDQELSDEDGNHLEQGQEEERQRTTMERATAQGAF